VTACVVEMIQLASNYEATETLAAPAWYTYVKGLKLTQQATAKLH